MAEKQEKTNFLGFVPAMLVQYLLEKINKEKLKFVLPEKQSVRSVVMFADISGFTNLTESLSRQGPEGCEKIAFAINRYMELMVKEIGKSGGDIFKFAGDAMIIVWPPSDGSQKTEITQIRKAVQSACVIQQKLNDTNIMDNIKLSVKIGFGVGRFSIIYVGGVFGRAEYLPAGDPLLQAFEAESFAKGGDIIVSQEVFEMVKPYFEFTQKSNGPDQKFSKKGIFYSVNKVIQKVRSKADAVLLTDKITVSEIESIKSHILSYIPKALQAYIEYEQEKWSSELRKLTIMFMNIGIDLTDAETNEGLTRIQKVIETVQKCVYFHEGSLNKFLMDDKGSTLIVVFGLPPMTHQDDACRAILCGFLLQSELEKINCKCSLGVSSGLVFAGVVGTSGNRREYSVIGDSVNLAARIMSEAKTQTKKELKFLCCENTMQLCMNQMSFMYWDRKLFKGKTEFQNIYQPLQMNNEGFRQLCKLNIFPNLKTHKFSFPIRENVIKQDLKEFEYMWGRNDLFRDTFKHLDNFIKSKHQTYFTLIRGTYGIGKSLFLRKLLLKCQDKMDTYRQYKYEERPFISVSSLNSFTRKHKMNGFRQVLNHLFKRYSKRVKGQPNKALLRKMIPYYDQNCDSKREDIQGIIAILNQIFGLEINDYIAKFTAPKNNFTGFNEKQEKTELVKCVKQFFSSYLEQEPIESDNSQSDFTDKEDFRKQSLFAPKSYVAPLVLCFDDLQYNDKLSFKMIRMVLNNFQRIYIIGALRDEYVEKPIFENIEDRSTEEIYENGIFKIEQILCDEDKEGRYRAVDLKSLKIEDLWEIIKNIFKVNEVSYLDPQIQKQLTEEGMNNNNLFCQQQFDIPKSYSYLFFSKIKKDLMLNPQEFLMNFIYVKVAGNPLTTIDLITSFLKQGLVVIKQVQNDSKVTFSQFNKRLDALCISNQLKKIIELEDLLIADTPYCCYQINGPLIDRLNNCLDIMVLKVASLIGDVFDIQILHKIHPFKDIIKADKLKNILFNLERVHFLEIMDQTDSNIYFRFQNPFIRECIYQRLTYQQRQQLHLQVAEAIQTLPQYDDDEDHEGERLVYHWCLGENKKDISIQDEFSHKAKRSIIVKKITTVLAKSQNNQETVVLKSDYLDKKSDSNVTWAPRYTVLDNKELKYYRYESEFKEKKQPLGIVPLCKLFQITALNEKVIGNKDFAFMLNTSGWIKKSKKMEERKFYFAARSDLNLEEWTLYLEFAKAKAQYDQFTNNFGKIPFPIGQSFSMDPAFKDFLHSNRRIVNKEIQQKQLSQGMSRRTTRATNFYKQIMMSSMKKDLVNKNSENQRIEKEQDALYLKDKLQDFLQKGMLMFFSHIFEMSLQKDESSYKSFGKMTKFQEKNPGLFDVSTSERPRDKYNQLSSSSNTFSDIDQMVSSQQYLPQKKRINSQSIQDSEVSSISDFSPIPRTDSIQGYNNRLSLTKYNKDVQKTPQSSGRFDENARNQIQLIQNGQNSSINLPPPMLLQQQQQQQNNRSKKKSSSDMLSSGKDQKNTSSCSNNSQKGGGGIGDSLNVFNSNEEIRGNSSINLTQEKQDQQGHSQVTFAVNNNNNMYNQYYSPQKSPKKTNKQPMFQSQVIYREEQNPGNLSNRERGGSALVQEFLPEIAEESDISMAQSNLSNQNLKKTSQTGKNISSIYQKIQKRASSISNSLPNINISNNGNNSTNNNNNINTSQIESLNNISSMETSKQETQQTQQVNNNNNNNKRHPSKQNTMPILNLSASQNNNNKNNNNNITPQKVLNPENISKSQSEKKICGDQAQVQYKNRTSLSSAQNLEGAVRSHLSSENASSTQDPSQNNENQPKKSDYTENDDQAQKNKQIKPMQELQISKQGQLKDNQSENSTVMQQTLQNIQKQSEFKIDLNLSKSTAKSIQLNSSDFVNQRESEMKMQEEQEQLLQKQLDQIECPYKIVSVKKKQENIEQDVCLNDPKYHTFIDEKHLKLDEMFKQVKFVGQKSLIQSNEENTYFQKRESKKRTNPKDTFKHIFEPFEGSIFRSNIQNLQKSRLMINQCQQLSNLLSKVNSGESYIQQQQPQSTLQQQSQIQQQQQDLNKQQFYEQLNQQIQFQQQQQQQQQQLQQRKIVLQQQQLQQQQQQNYELQQQQQLQQLQPPNIGSADIYKEKYYMNNNSTSSELNNSQNLNNNSQNQGLYSFPLVTQQEQDTNLNSQQQIINQVRFNPEKFQKVYNNNANNSRVQQESQRSDLTTTRSKNIENPINLGGNLKEPNIGYQMGLIQENNMGNDIGESRNKKQFI